MDLPTGVSAPLALPLPKEGSSDPSGAHPSLMDEHKGTPCWAPLLGHTAPSETP